ncbi:hypothetical protein L2E82_49012 [Cichorium intybus]|uniref:Uncharacterized protein n=1 Tax=Cichorium intybus TaxID=13427 RepID=A0ACB8Z0R9_CICIN|nr:hypothetical protein L2E82_49012 [Cichorium intybus]
MLKPWIVPYCIFRCLPETLATSPSLYLSISRPPENHNPRNQYEETNLTFITIQQTTGFSNLKKEWLKAKRFRLNTILTQSGMPIWIWVFADSYTPLPPAFLRAYSSSVSSLSSPNSFKTDFASFLSFQSTRSDVRFNFSFTSYAHWASVAFGAGVGIGSAYSECSHKFNEA